MRSLRIFRLFSLVFSQTVLVIAASLILAVASYHQITTSTGGLKAARKQIALVQSQPTTIASINSVIKAETKVRIAPQPAAPPPALTVAPPPSVSQPPLIQAQPVLPQSVPSTNLPVYSRLITTQPVVFLGIDDGLTQSPETLTWLTSHKLPFTLFLNDDSIKNNYDYFLQLQQAGMTIEDHTLSHPYLDKLSLEQQTSEICGTADKFQAIFGRRPVLLRPPYGTFNEQTKQAAASCGIKAIITWHAKVNGGSLQYQDGNDHLLPGDIVLMHFRPEFLQDMQAFVDQVQKDNLQIGHLEDWLP